MRDKLLYLDWRAFPPSYIHGKHLIIQVHRRSEEGECQGRRGLDTRCDFLTQGLLEIQTDTTINVIFGDAEADTYKYEPIDKLLASWEKENKYKHVKHFHEQWKHFSPFFL